MVPEGRPMPRNFEVCYSTSATTISNFSTTLAPWHTHGQLIDEPTIGTCWDADRLDLGRVGTEPEARYMSTDFGREIAAHGSIETFIQRAGAA